MNRRILLTGIAGALAGALARRLEADERVEHLVGIDLTAPTHDLARTEFLRADLRNALVGKVVKADGIDTIIHLAVTAAPRDVGGRARMKELNVIGTMQLLGAATKAPRLRKVVVKSTTAVYGSSHRDPALFREDAATGSASRASGYTKDALEVEAYARAFGRRRQDVTLTILRFANFVGPTVETPLTSYLGLPVVPTVLGYDPRLQLCHEADAVEVLLRSVHEDHPGIVNVAGPGILYLSQAIRLAGKVPLPVPLPLVDTLAGIIRRTGAVDFSPDQLQFLRFGRVGDIRRLREDVGYEPRWSTRAAFEDFLEHGRLTPLVERVQVERLEERAGDFLVRAARTLGAKGAG